MEALNERLEVRLSSETLRLLRQEAKQKGIPIAQLVRKAIDMMLKEDTEYRLGAAEALFQIEAPVADWPEMKKEIEDAHLKGGK